MKRRSLAALLLVLCAGAAYSASAAIDSVRPAWEWALPQEIYSRFTEREEDAAYLLQSRQGLVAVFEGENRRSPAAVTDIEVSLLRRADQAMLEKGIPVADREQLLMLLEDLGS